MDMADTYLSLSGDSCSSATLCSTPSGSNANSDLDLDTATDNNAAWAGIAVVIVVAAVGAGVWFSIRRRRRSRGGHNSVDTGTSRSVQFAFVKRWNGFWRRPRAEQPASESQLEQGTDESKDDRRSSSASNLKRTPTANSQVNAPPAAKLASQPKEDHYPMVPLHHPQLQSTETFTSIPPESHHPSRNPRDSLASSHRSSGSLSRINIPPPGLGPPIHRSESLSSTLPTRSASTSQPPPQN
ncbi:unnamed protein product [Rhizoctonia solani]|uniref:Uncharacterized protein n=1 Tax=Rhizoctonia solani TaxID=456999 RepID=A0A8H3DKW2_9AGAM|nr:unnamed protein product [Rhizoctonia solani]